VRSATPKFSDLDSIGYETAFINELAIWTLLLPATRLVDVDPD
jgi:hypothetical protein